MIIVYIIFLVVLYLLYLIETEYEKKLKNESRERQKYLHNHVVNYDDYADTLFNGPFSLSDMK